MLKSLLYFCILFNSILYSKEISVVLQYPFYKDKLYEGNIENGKMNGNGIIYELEKNKKIKFAEGKFENDNIINGSFFKNKKFYNEIKYGIIQNQKIEKDFEPIVMKEIYGHFNKPKDLNSFISILNNNLNVDMQFANTQSYDTLKGKLNIIKDELYVNGTLTLFNNKIQSIKATFNFKDLKFYKDKIYIVGNDFIIDGYVNDGSNINDFKFEGVIQWNEGLEYYVTNYNFKENFFNQLDNFKKLATPIQNNNINKTKIIKDNLKESKIEVIKKDIKIDTSNIKYKNKELYGNDDSKLNLEK